MTTPVAPTTSDMLPSSPWLRPRPIYGPATSNTIPTGFEFAEQPTPLPWGTAPVPPLPPMPAPRESRPTSTDRFGTTTRSKSTSRPSKTPTQANRPSRPGPSAPPQRPVPSLTLVPVVVKGVPGSTHEGIDLVSLLCIILLILVFILLL